MIPLRHPFLFAVAGLIALALAIAGTASAQTTIGEVAAPSTTTQYCSKGPFDSIPSGPTVSLYTVPTDGVITSWSNQTGGGIGQELSFKVFRPVAGETAHPKFLVVGTDGPRSLAPNALNTFQVEIPVKAGDLIGDNDQNAAIVNNACLFRTTNPADITFFHEGSVASGSTFEVEGYEKEAQMNVAATLLAAPTVSAVTPADGPAAGGTTITIIGSEFAHVKSVTIGSEQVPFNVASETTITATTTAGTAGLATTVAVTTIAGSGAGAFNYDPICKVPKLKGRKLPSAKKALVNAHCKLGKVTKKKGVTTKSGKVVKANPGQGSSRKAGAKISVKLG